MANTEFESKQNREQPSFEPRLESFIISWEKMTDDQRKAASQTLKLLKKIATSNSADKYSREFATSSRSAAFLPHIDPERRNHVILIDGDRGSGKTALLITLLHVLERPILRLSPSEGTAELYDLFADIKGRIVPLEHIDLVRLPAGTNLAMHLTSVLQKVVAAMEQDSEPGYGTSSPLPSERWALSARHELKSRTKWRKLLKSVAAGREGGLSQRRAQVDPETYAFELEQAERERLDLDSSFRAFVDALVVDYKEWSGANAEPLFVLAIDDADMNPSLCLELLELIRTLWHPRVAFVLAGDSQTFLDVLQVSLEKILRVGGSSPDVFVTNRIRKLSQQIYDKTIPPSQRNELKALKPSERFPHFRNLLSNTLISFLAARENRESTPLELINIFELQPQLGEVFPDRLRALNDLHDSIEHQYIYMRSRGEWALIKSLLHPLWESALRDSQFQPEQVAQFEEMLKFDELSKSFFVSLGQLTLRDVPRVIAAGLSENDWQIHFLRPNRTEVSASAAKALPPRLAGAILLAINIAQNASRGMADIEQHQMALGAQVSPRLGTPVSIPWPLPSLPTLIDHCLFGLAWETLVPHRFRLGSTEIDALAQCFLRMVCWFARNRDAFLEAILRALQAGHSLENIAKQELRHLELGSNKNSWSVVVEEIASLVTGNDGDPQDGSKHFTSWALFSTGLMATPEAGLSSTGARELLNGLSRRLTQIWPNIQGSLRSRRLEHVMRNAYWRDGLQPSVRREAAEHLIRQIDNLLPNHPWNTLIQKPQDTSGTQDSFNPKETLRLVPLSKLSQRPTSHTTTLADYISAQRNKDLTTIPQELIPAWLSKINSYSEKDSPAELLYELWKLTTRDDESGLVNLINYDASRRLRIDDVIKAPIRNDIAEVTNGQDSLTFSQMNPTRNVGMYPYQHALYRIIWDFWVDDKDAELEDSSIFPAEFSPRWQGFSLRFGGAMRWPTVEWPAQIDWELIFAGWNDSLNQMRAKLASNRAELISQSTDYLCFSYLSNLYTVFTQRTVGLMNPARALDADAWTSLWTKLVEAVKEPRLPGARLSAFERWLKVAPVMAAPESGISVVAATGILNALGELDKPMRDKLRLLRFQYLLEQTHVDEEEFERNVYERDDERSAHPWVDRVER